MNKAELKSFAILARNDLLENVALRAKLFGIDQMHGLNMVEQFGQLFVNGQTYPVQLKSVFFALENELKTKGYAQLIEEVAYSWFNRIIAIRYMEVNGFLPERVNVLSSSTEKVEPDILQQFETMDLNIDPMEIKKYINRGETEKAFRKLFIAQCNALNNILPFIFETINDYTELLLPDFLLDSESVINKLVKNDVITECFSEVEVIGWVCQFYNSEPKDRVFENLKKKKRIRKFDIPAATQLFTPKWIVQYMVENSFGQLWKEDYPSAFIDRSLPYFIESVEQLDEVRLKFAEYQNKNLNLEHITILDPCVGSGHILVYAFDILFHMYEEAGYPTSEIPELILESNLFGLDIDDRAAQLASFTLMMKAREKSRHILNRKISPNIFTVQESNGFDHEGILSLLCENQNEKNDIASVLETFHDAKNFGSIIKAPSIDYAHYLARIVNMGECQLTTETFVAVNQLKEFQGLLKLAVILSNTYDLVITNPPYMGGKGMNTTLKDFVEKHYPDSKFDLYSVMIERCLDFVKTNGYVSMVTMDTWMTKSKFENFRKKMIENQIISLLHLGTDAFEELKGEIVQTVSFVIKKCKMIPDYVSTFLDIRRYESQNKPIEYFNKENRFYSKSSQFHLLDGSPIVYWLSETMYRTFSSPHKMEKLAKPRSGITTGNNDKYVRYWFEVAGEKRQTGMDFDYWIPFNNGGEYRKWYGNNYQVVYWANGGEDIYKDPSSTIANMEFQLKRGITWGKISNNNLSVRFTEEGFLFSAVGLKAFPSESCFYLIGALLNSKVAKYMLPAFSSSLSILSGDIAKMPVWLPEQRIHEIINELTQENIKISKADWNSSEISWDFLYHPLMNRNRKTSRLMEAFLDFAQESEDKISKLKQNEETLNKIFIELYGLQDEITPEINDQEITIRAANRLHDTKSFLSYFIGCLMGRYSLDHEGIVFAGCNWDDALYQSFKPNTYGLILFTEENYFEADIIVRLREFLTVIFGKDTMEENLQWLAESLELKRNESVEDRLRRYFMDEFFKDHLQTYQKKPIYWLVDAGKQKSLRTLIYLHRYQPDTMATIRFEHLQGLQAKYINEINTIDICMVNPNLSAAEKRELERKKTMYQKRVEELIAFDKELATYANAQIVIDLDDGVAMNYATFGKILAPLK